MVSSFVLTHPYLQLAAGSILEGLSREVGHVVEGTWLLVPE